MERKALPEHFCIFPWVHAQVYQTGDVRPCCRSRDLSYGSVRESDFDEIWNGEAIRNFRLAMLSEKVPAACRDCHHFERIGGQSRRIEANAEFHDEFSRVGATAPDGSVASSPLAYLDIRFSNVCNFRCRICDPERSTGWYHDAKALGISVQSAEPLRPFASREKTREFLEARLPHLRKLSFVGGEPLLHDEHYETLERLVGLGRTDVALAYSTNFSTLSHRHWSALSLWQKFGSVSIAASFDGIGKQAALLRRGTNWREIEENFRRLRLFVPRAHFYVHTTVSALNCFHLPAAIDRWLELGMVAERRMFVANLLFEPAHYNLNVLREAERQALSESYREYLDRLRGRVSVGVFRGVHARLQAILRFFEDSLPTAERERFDSINSQLDRLRGENFRELFPELSAHPDAAGTPALILRSPSEKIPCRAQNRR